MSRFLWFLCSILLCSQAHGLDLKVQKVKGRRAIVVFSERGAVEPGDELSVVQTEDAFASSSSKSVGSFKHSFTGMLDLENISYDTGGTSDLDASRTNFEGRFGWVRPKFEVGPIFIYQSQTISINTGFGSTSVESKSTLIGGYGEYNFDMKDPQFIPSAGLILGHVSSELGGDVSGFRFEPYARIKYFLARNSGFAALGQLGYRIDELSGNGQDVSGKGFVLRVGMGYYF